MSGRRYLTRYKWLKEAGWNRVRIEGGVVLDHNLADRTIVIYPTFTDISQRFVFRDGAQLSFPFQLGALMRMVPGGLGIGMVRRPNGEFESDRGSAEFMRECTAEIIAWAKGIDPEAEVKKLATVECENYNHLVALASLGEVERLRALFERQRALDPDAPYVHGTLLPSIKPEVIERAVEVAEYYRQHPMDWSAPVAPPFCQPTKQTRKLDA